MRLCYHKHFNDSFSISTFTCIVRLGTFVHMFTKFIHLFIVFIFVCSINLSAQTATIAITDGTKPLPYATVINLRSGFGMFATDKGEVDLNSNYFLKGDTLRISYTGYADTLIGLPAASVTIVLRAVAVALQAVEVYPCLNSKMVILKNYIKHKKNFSFSMGALGAGSWAAYVPNRENTNGYIETITIEQSFFTVPSHARRAPFKVRLLQFDSASGLPGKPLLAKEWVVYPTSNVSVVIIGNENLRLPKHGVVVSVDYYFSGQQYAYKRKVQELSTDGTRTNVWQNQYGAGFRGVKGENLIGYGYMRGKSDTWMALHAYRFEDKAIMVKMAIKKCN